MTDHPTVVDLDHSGDPDYDRLTARMETGLIARGEALTPRGGSPDADW